MFRGWRGWGRRASRCQGYQMQHIVGEELRLTIRLRKDGKVRGREKTTQIARQLFTGQVWSHRRIQRFGAQQHRDRPQRTLAEQPVGIRPAVNQAEVLTRTRILTAVLPGADSRRFQILAGSVVEERRAEAGWIPDRRQNEGIVPQPVFPASGVAEQRIVRSEYRRYANRNVRAAIRRSVFGPVENQLAGDQVLIPCMFQLVASHLLRKESEGLGVGNRARFIVT